MVLQGRGLFYGATHGSMDEQVWIAECQQARAWGMAYVHPKVADRTGYWYNDAELAMLRDVARSHGLLCYPYYYVTVTNWARQADMMAHVGNIFGGVVPDMEDEWFRQPAIAMSFGQRLRAQFRGLVIPTLYADPQVISQYPYTETLRWCDAWMPMAYFDVWTEHGMPMTAAEATAWLQPQWNELNKHLVSQNIHPPAILPLIAVDIAKLPVVEVVNWLHAWQGILGYCGFWHDGTYGPYAEAVLHAPVPTWGAPAPKPAPAPTPEPVRTSTPPPPPAPQQPQQPEEQVPFIPGTPLPGNVFFPAVTSGMAQHLSEKELVALWHRNRAGIPWVPQHALTRYWVEAVQFHPELGLGSPLADEQHSDLDGQPLQRLKLDSGHELTYFQASGRVVLIGGATVLAGTLPGAGVFTPPAPVSPPTPAASTPIAELVTPAPVVAAAPGA